MHKQTDQWLPNGSHFKQHSYFPDISNLGEQWQMTIADLLTTLGKKDIKLWLDGDNLRFSAPEGAFTDSIKSEIIAQKPDIIAFLKSVQVAKQTASQPSIPIADRSQPVPLSFAQQRMWLLQELDPSSSAYHMPIALKLVGDLNIDALSYAIEEIFKRHETLRTCFIEPLMGNTADSADEPQQRIQPPNQAFALDIQDFSKQAPLSTHHSPAESNPKILQAIEDYARKPFDLSRDTMMRVRLLKLANTAQNESQWILLITLHHICSDGWSTGILIKELTSLYHSHSQQSAYPLQALPVQYADYSQWQRDWFQGEKLEKQINYWRQELDAAPLLEMPTDFPRPPEISGAGAGIKFALTSATSAKISEFCNEKRITPFVLLISVYYCLLHKYSGQSDICIGTPVANREREELYPLIGLFLNTLVLRAHLSDHDSFDALLQAVQATQLKAFDNQDLPFETVVDALKLPQDMSHTPVFQALFVLQNNDTPQSLSLDNIEFSLIQSSNNTAKYDLTLALALDAASGIYSGGLEFNTDLFKLSTAQNLVQHYEKLLECVLSNSACAIPDLNPLSDAQINQQITQWNQTEVAVDTQTTVQELFEAQAAKTPNAVAVYFNDQHLTYAQLNQRANQIGHLLVEMNVSIGERVAFLFDRHIDLMPVLLGILKAGAIYVPLDAAYPKDRLSYMITDSALNVILTRSSLANRLPKTKATIIATDRHNQIHKHSVKNLKIQYDLNQLLYVIYTSGSTGTPKCTGAYQRSEINLLHWYTTQFDMTISQRVLLISALGFDLTQKNFFAPLIKGAAIVIPDMEFYDADLLRQLIAKHKVSWINCAPSMFYPLLEEDHSIATDLTSLQYVFLGGESIQFEHVSRWYRNSECLLINSYGPTECADIACYHVVEKNIDLSKAIPLGRPNYNVRLYVLDQHKKLVPIGAIGELYIGGDGVGPGYLNDLEKTKASFIQNPFTDKPDTLYKTGDLVQYDEHGLLHFMGRTDFQVKLRGLRIELSEIENALSECGQIKQACVLAKGDRGNEQLVAYITLTINADPSNDESEAKTSVLSDVKAKLYEELHEKLPSYMVPDQFVTLEQLPLTANGKVNRKALPEPDFLQIAQAEYLAPRNDIEHALVEIWQSLLNTDKQTSTRKIGVLDDFFQLGGHSIIAAKANARIRREFQVVLPLRTLFRNPTIRTIAKHIASTKQSIDDAIPIVSRDLPMPLSFAQQRAWIVQQINPLSTAYNMPVALRLTGDINIEAMKTAFLQLALRHETLRTRFAELNGELSQVIDIISHWTIPIDDISHLSAELQETRILSEVNTEANTPFDLARDRLLRTRLLKLQPGTNNTEMVLLATKHHIISDGWSMGILLREFSALYYSAVTHTTTQIEALPIQYADFAAWQRNWLSGDVLAEQLDYWKQTLAEVPILEMPTDYPRTAEITSNGAALAFTFDAELSLAVNSFCKKKSITPTMLLLSVYYILLHKYSGQTDLCVGTPIANRTHPELENLIGFFINILVLRAQFKPTQSFDELLAQVTENNLNAYQHQDLPLEKLLEELNLTPDLSRDNPLFQTLFVMQNNDMGSFDGNSGNSLAGMHIESIEREHNTAKYELTLNFSEMDNRWFGSMEYNTDLYSKPTIQRLMGHYKVLLRTLIKKPGQAINEISLLSPTEINQQLYDWNQTKQTVDTSQCAHQLFELQASRTPDAVAISFNEEQLSYSQLNTLSNKTAHYLIQNGVSRSDRVGVCFSRHPYWLAAVIGVLKAGASYVPLDASYPIKRLEYMIDDSNIKHLLTLTQLSKALPSTQCRITCLDMLSSDPHSAQSLVNSFGLNEFSSDNPNVDVDPKQLIYVIYTSGSTGKPKCTGAYHHAETNLIHWYTRAYSMTPQDKLLLISAVGFDLTQKNLFAPLAVGAEIVIPDMDEYDHELLINLIKDKRISWINCAPSAFYPLQDEPEDYQKLKTLRRVFLGGEPIQLPRLKNWLTQSNCCLINSYGPTECTDITTSHVVDPYSSRSSVPIGKPSYNVNTYILDANDMLIPQGAIGELCITGSSVGPGYLNDPAQTASAFFDFRPIVVAGKTYQTDSEHDGNSSTDTPANRNNRKAYRSGDLARYLPNGDIELIGRKDNQIKLHGLRIELEEINHALNTIDEIREGFCIVDKKHERLIAYVVTASTEQELDRAALRAELILSLPEFMVPKFLVELDSLPLTPNGKVDTKALPEPDQLSSNQSFFMAPETELQHAIVDIWQELLGTDKIGINDNFFDRGGHSISATQVVSRIRKQFNVQLPLRELFKEPTIAAIASAIESGRYTDADPIEPAPRSELMPLSFNQQQLWIVSQLEPNSSAYNMPGAVRICGPIDTQILQQAFIKVMERHEVLRTQIFETKGEGWQQIQSIDQVTLPFKLLDLQTTLTSDEQEACIKQHIQTERELPFNISNGPLFRIKVLKLSNEEHVLMITLHHIISDGWSLNVLLEDFGANYQALIEQRSWRQPPLAIQYADFAVWQRQQLSGEALARLMDFWQAKLDPEGFVLNLPTDYERPKHSSDSGAFVELQIDTTLAEQFKLLNSQRGTTLYMGLLSVFQVLLARLSGQAIINVGSPSAGRSHEETEALIGFFINTMVLSVDCGGPLSFSQLLQRTKTAALDAYTHEDTPFEKIVEAVNPERDMSRTPIFQVFFNLLNLPESTQSLSGITIENLSDGDTKQSSKFDITLYAHENTEGLLLSMLYNSSLFSAETVNKLLAKFKLILNAVVDNEERDIRSYDLALPEQQFTVEMTKPFQPQSFDHPLQLIASQVAIQPSKVVVNDCYGNWTYEQLDAVSNSVANSVIKAGIEPEDVVAIYGQRSAALISAVLGCAKSAATFLLLDPGYPLERTARYLKAAKPLGIISIGPDEFPQQLIEQLPVKLTRQLAWLADDNTGSPNLNSTLPKVCGSNDTSLAYLTFTSGTKGQPKGIKNTWAPLAHFLHWYKKEFSICADDCFSMLSGIAHDPIFRDIFAPLSNGARISIPADTLAGQGDKLITWMRTEAINVIHATPALIDSLRFASTDGDGDLTVDQLPDLRLALLGGETLSTETIAYLSNLGNNISVLNCYGASETPQVISCADVTNNQVNSVSQNSAQQPTIGNGIDDVQLCLLNDQLQLVAPGELGEIYVRTPYLSLGYLDESLNGAAFIINPKTNDSTDRLYKTGDLGRYNNIGQVIFHGRKDDQVNIRGYRIELTEIDTALSHNPHISNSVTLMRPNKAGDEFLVSYIVEANGVETNTVKASGTDGDDEETTGREATEHSPNKLVDMLRLYLSSLLPDYMVPSAFITINEIPLTLNGKIDKRFLPNLDDFFLADEAYVAPSTDVERAVADLWQIALKREKISVNANFFNIGGHSLLAVKIVSQIKQAYDVEFTLKTLFEASTIAGMSAYIENVQWLRDASGSSNSDSDDYDEEREDFEL